MSDISYQNNKGEQIMATPVLHGENFLAPVDALPRGKAKHTKTLVVGHSETGHHHVLECDTDIEVVEGIDTYFKLTHAARIKHLKSFDIHETLTVEPGIYKVTHKTEYNPWTKVLQRVFD